VLRAILGSYLAVPAGHVQFSYGPQGKPSLAGAFRQESLRFNLAHAGGLSLYAVTLSRELGVDIERIHAIPDATRIAEHFFSPQERDALAALPEEQRQEAFFRCWTRKEAYLKAVGDGLARPPDQVQVSLTPGEPARVLGVSGDPHEAKKWSLREVMPADGYIAALAVEGHSWGLSCWQWAG
jgi:4'-phosphopantetheinyl transferase